MYGGLPPSAFAFMVTFGPPEQITVLVAVGVTLSVGDTFTRIVSQIVPLEQPLFVPHTV